jgi:hypothetical protein
MLTLVNKSILTKNKNKFKLILISRDSSEDIATDWTAEVQFPTDPRDFSLLIVSRPALGFTQPLSSGYRLFFPLGKAAGE